jgi:3-hydroxyisobutyrate dehydrogenase
MLPAGKHVRDIYLTQSGLAAATAPGAVLIDSSTIDVATAREVAAAMPRPMLDAPVSGGTMGAENGTLAFMVGWREVGLREGEAGAGGDGQDHRPLRRRRQRPGGEGLQQHDARPSP